jgi:release factor glutamine methyltransferase
MTTESPMTVLEVLQATTAYFKKRSVENPRLNAEHLLAHVLGRKRIELYLDFERKLTENRTHAVARSCETSQRRRASTAFLGTVEFCGHVFLCDKPPWSGPETEELVEFLKSEIQDPKSEDCGWSVLAAA